MPGQGQEIRAQRIVQGEPGGPADAVPPAGLADADTRAARRRSRPARARSAGPSGTPQTRADGGPAVVLEAPAEPTRKVQESERPARGLLHGAHRRCWELDSFRGVNFTQHHEARFNHQN